MEVIFFKHFRWSASVDVASGFIKCLGVWPCINKMQYDVNKHFEDT